MTNDAAALARFEREAVSVAKAPHLNILSIFEFGGDAGAAFIVMDLVNDETLRARLDAGPIPARKATAYALQIAKGLGAAHARGIVDPKQRVSRRTSGGVLLHRRAPGGPVRRPARRQHASCR